MATQQNQVESGTRLMASAGPGQPPLCWSALAQGPDASDDEGEALPQSETQRDSEHGDALAGAPHDHWHPDEAPGYGVTSSPMPASLRLEWGECSESRASASLRAVTVTVRGRRHYNRSRGGGGVWQFRYALAKDFGASLAHHLKEGGARLALKARNLQHAMRAGTATRMEPKEDAVLTPGPDDVIPFEAPQALPEDAVSVGAGGAVCRG